MAAGRAGRPADLMRAALARRASAARPGKSAAAAAPADPSGPAGADDTREAPAGVTPPADLEPVGRVVDSYGVDGRIKVHPFGAMDESVLLACNQWWVHPPAGAPSAGTAAQAARVPWQVSRARVHGAVIVARVAGLADREAALRWRGAEILVSRARFPAPAEGEYYWVDLVGCQVFDRAGAALGRVEAVDDHGAHALLRVAPTHGASFLIPFVEAYVDRVDLAARRIEVDWQADY